MGTADARSLSLWWARLDGEAATLREFESCLSSDERQRAEVLSDPRQRRRFIASRSALRSLLARELGCAPGQIRIVADERGKPYVPECALRFSAARSEGVALYATSWTMDVGVDIEATRPITELAGLAARFFSATERRALDAEPSPARRLQAAVECWTCKEAYGKAMGRGLDFALRSVDVWSDTRRRVQGEGWAVEQVDVGPGFAAAVAAPDGSDWVVSPPRLLDVGTSGKV